MLALAYATGRASMPDRSRVMTHEKGYADPPGWGLGVKLTTPPHKKVVTKLQGNEVGWISWQKHKAIHKGLRLSCAVVTTKIIYWVLGF